MLIQVNHIRVGSTVIPIALLPIDEGDTVIIGKVRVYSAEIPVIGLTCDLAHQVISIHGHAFCKPHIGSGVVPVVVPLN